MIKFFRKIRYDLMEKNKTGKYLKYAIGEIILVVIGILIALSINNWNEESKSKDFEIKMLSEIRNSLNQDLTFFTNHLSGRNEQLAKCISNFEKAIISNSFSKASLDSNFKCLNIGFQIQYSRGPYDALKATGLDKITNDSLRNKLINVYDFIYPRYKSLIETNSGRTYDIMSKVRKELTADWKTQIDGDKLKYVGGGLADIDIKNSSEFTEFLKAAKDRYNFSKDRLQGIEKHILGLIKQIDVELE
jgi:Family of unknown function (DUF6090)